MEVKILIFPQDQVANGDVEVGEAEVAYMDEMPEPAELTWEDLEYRVKAGTPPRPKTVVHKCSGTFKPGDSVALMGPSGAGRSLAQIVH